jgi:hypothetical protein
MEWSGERKFARLRESRLEMNGGLDGAQAIVNAREYNSLKRSGLLKSMHQVVP